MAEQIDRFFHLNRTEIDNCSDEVFFDCFCTAFNQIAVPLALVKHAGSIGMLDEGMLSNRAIK